MGELLFLHSVSSKGTVAKHLKHTIKDIENEIMSHVRIFLSLAQPGHFHLQPWHPTDPAEIRRCHRICEVCCKCFEAPFEPWIWSPFLVPRNLGTVSLEIIHEAKRKKLGIPTRAIRGPMSIGLMTIGSNGGKPRLTKTVNTVVECVDPLTQIRTMHVLYTWQGRESTME